MPINLIPYQGSAPLIVDLMAGRIDAAFDSIASSLPHLRGGKLRALCVSGAKRSAVAPEVPTPAEAGIEGYAHHAWQGLFAPKGTPAQATALIADAVQRALTSSAVLTRLRELGLEISPGSPAEFEALIARDAESWDAMVRKGLVRAS